MQMKDKKIVKTATITYEVKFRKSYTNTPFQSNTFRTKAETEEVKKALVLAGFDCFEVNVIISDEDDFIGTEEICRILNWKESTLYNNWKKMPVIKPKGSKALTARRSDILRWKFDRQKK